MKSTPSVREVLKSRNSALATFNSEIKKLSSVPKFQSFIASSVDQHIFRILFCSFVFVFEFQQIQKNHYQFPIHSGGIWKSTVTDKTPPPKKKKYLSVFLPPLWWVTFKAGILNMLRLRKENGEGKNKICIKKDTMDICFLDNKWAYLVGDRRWKQMFTGNAAENLFPPLSCFIWTTRNHNNLFYKL